MCERVLQRPSVGASSSHLQLLTHFANLSPAMSQPFLSNLTLVDFDGKFQLYLSDRALRFTDSGEQNMKIIPRDSVAAVTVRDTDLSFSTTDIPKALGFTLVSMALSGWLEPWQGFESQARMLFVQRVAMHSLQLFVVLPVWTAVCGLRFLSCAREMRLADPCTASSMPKVRWTPALSLEHWEEGECLSDKPSPELLQAHFVQTCVPGGPECGWDAGSSATRTSKMDPL